MTQIVLITGMSGAGRSATADVLEDLGWYVVDNLPTSLVEKVVDLASLPGSGIDRLALVAGRNYGEVLDNVSALRAAGHRVTVLFLDAQTPELVRRYDATRRKHPLAAEADGLVESIELERSLLAGTRDAADLVVDTSELNVHQLKERIVAAFDVSSSSKLQVAVESFGFKHGLPLDADRARPRRAPVRARAGRHGGVPRPPRRPAPHDPPRLPGRGPQLSHRRDRLHRRPPPLRRHRRGPGDPPPQPRHRGPHHPPRRLPLKPGSELPGSRSARSERRRIRHSASGRFARPGRA